MSVSADSPAAGAAAPPRSTRSVPIGLPVFLCALWGLNQIVVKLGNTGISPLAHAGLRSAGATLVLLGWIAWRKVPILNHDRTLWPGVIAGLLFAVEFVFMFIGLQYTTAARAIVLINCTPFFVALGSHWLIPSERLSRRKVFGLAAAFSGVVLLFYDRLTTPDARGLLGDACLLLAALGWAATTLVVKASPMRSAAPEKNLLYQLAVSAVVLLASAAWAGERWIFDPSPTVIGLLLYQIFVVASASYLAWFWLIARHSATVLHTFTFLTPMFGVLFGWLLLNEPVSAALAGAMLLIAGGIVMVNRA